MVIVKNIAFSPRAAQNDGSSRMGVRCRVFSVHDFASIRSVWVDLRHTSIFDRLPIKPDPGFVLDRSGEGDYSGEIEIPLHLEPGRYRIPIVAEDSTGARGRGMGTFLVDYKRREDTPPVGSPEFIRQLENLTGEEFTSGNTVRVLDGGADALNLRFSLIEGASRQINLQTYALGGSGSGARILDTLIRKAEEGVSVNMVLNSDTQLPVSPVSALRLKFNQFLSDLGRNGSEERQLKGNAKGRREKKRRVRMGGITALFFNRNPLFEDDDKDPLTGPIKDHWLQKLQDASRRIKGELELDELKSTSGAGPGGLPALPLLDYAVHEKILVVDGRYAIVGGRNLEDKYFTHWTDLDLALSGPIVGRIQAGFLSGFAQIAASAPNTRLPEAIAEWTEGQGGVSALFVNSRPWERKYGVTTAMVHSIEAATMSIFAFSQFVILPDCIIKDALMDAARRGVDVRIITNSQNTGQEVSFSAGYYLTIKYLAPLLEAGVRVFEVVGGPNPEEPQPYMHNKEFIFDDSLCAIGSFNLSVRSCYVESENLVFINDTDFCRSRISAFLGFQERYTREISAEQLAAQQGLHKTKMEMSRFFELLF